ncbi:MAG TPA: helix-turn-helix domain-containing protein [bacterium]|nr:helix-turn-helix domain-containing protein [bacterium]
METKIIKNEKDYKAALARIDELFDIPEGDPREDELELLYMLVEKYEEENYKIDLPDPIEAIKFRMEQSGMDRKDLAKYIGSMSKVSEILNRKRPLSLSMIRALHEGLGIPAEVLLKDSTAKLNSCKYEMKKFPFSEMFKRGYFDSDCKNLNEVKEYWEECLEKLFCGFNRMKLDPCYRKSKTGLGDDDSLKAWLAKVINLVNEENLPSYNRESLENAVDRIVKLSYFPSGVQLVKEALNKTGIHFVILSHLPKTRLDGACFLSEKGNPVIAMTLRYDRLDNFWFTLLHEIGHIYNEDINSSNKLIMDDIESDNHSDKKEVAADKFALNAFIPLKTWNKNKELLLTKTDVIKFSEQLGISPAVVAGRIRKEESDYTKFSDLVGNGKVREQFKGIL